MNTLYLDCGMGAAGDMLTAALLELFPDPDGILEGLNAIGVPGVVFTRQRKASHGIMGSSVRVLVNGMEEPDCSGHISLERDHHHGPEQEAGPDSGCGHEHHHDHDHGHDHHRRHPHLYFHSHGHGHGHEEDIHDHLHSHAHADNLDHKLNETDLHIQACATLVNSTSHDHSDLEEQGQHGHDHDHEHHHEHHHTSMAEMEARIDGLRLEPRIRENVREVFALIASAEAKVHGQPLESIHFHEVGGMDALADIAAVCFLMDCLDPDEVVVSPIHVGSGHVHCAHGILPVPAPATAEILKGIPVYGGKIQGELCTPTGAALLRHFASRFGPMPAMTVNNIGYGLGKRDFGQPNCLRAMIGTNDLATVSGQADGGIDEVFELTCNLDDMTAENLAFACQILLEAGALDVWTIPAMMKKSRPGHLLCLLCRPEDRVRMLELLFRHTTTIGIREQRLGRHLLQREERTIQTSLGPVRYKESSGFGISRIKYEHDDLEALSRANGLSIAELVAILSQDQ